MHFIDQSEKSEIVKFCFGVPYPKKEHYHIMSKKEKQQSSKTSKCDLVKNVRDISLNFALRGQLKSLLSISMRYWTFDVAGVIALFQ